MTRNKHAFYPDYRHLIGIGLIAIAVYVLLPQLSNFSSSWQLLSHPRPVMAAIAIGLTFATYMAAAGTYCLLAFKSLRYLRTLIVQLAAMAVNRLLPAGIGALGANYLYLKHERHTASQSISMVAINNLLGFTGHALIVATVLLLLPGTAFSGINHSTAHAVSVLRVVLLLLAVALAAAWLFGRRKVVKALRDIKTQLFSYRHRPLSLVGALGTSMILTICNVLSLYFCLLALGVHLSFAAVLLVFSFGVGAAAAVPTPGGLGGFEAGLAAGFVAYRVEPSAALAAALLYRLISYWLPLIIGLAALVFCQRRKYFGI